MESTGNRQPGIQPALYEAESGFTTMPLNLAARESVFVVFRNSTAEPKRTVAPAAERERAAPGPRQRVAAEHS